MTFAKDIRERRGIRGEAIRLCLVACVAVALCVYVSSFLDYVSLSVYGTSTGICRGVLSTEGIFLIAKVFVPCLLIVVLLFGNRCVVHTIVRLRYPIALAVLLVCVAFEISGSSVAMYSLALGEEPLQGTLFGIPRAIRSDEWMVFTPLTIAQSATGNQAISETIRATATNVTLSIGQPAWTIATIFRPFLWGYLFLGPSRGLSFFWVGRLLAVLLVSYELMSLLSKGDEALSLAGALMVGFSPALQWWFAVNEAAELFIFGQGLVLCLHYLVRTSNHRLTWLLSFLLAWQMGCFLFVLYPAWQVPFFYIFAAMGIANIVLWVNECCQEGNVARVRRVLGGIAIPFITSLCLIILLTGLSLYLAKDALLATANSSYPGARLETGGKFFSYLANIPLALATPVKDGLYVNANVCEQACFVAFWPLGLFLGVRMAWQRQDPVLVGLLVAAAFLWSFALFGFPLPLAKLTLMNNVTSGLAHERLQLPLGYLDVVMLVRALAERGENSVVSVEERMTAVSLQTRYGVATSAVLGVAALYGLALVLVGRYTSVETMDKIQSLVVLVVFGLGGAICLLPLACFDTRFRRGEALLIVSSVIVACGLFINPLQRGVQAITGSALATEVKAIVADDPEGQWLADTDTLAQLCVASGARTINSIALYPDLERWSALDPTGEWYDIYNRHAHINVEPADETDFELRGDVGNAFVVRVTPEDVVTLGADYWVSAQDLSGFGDDGIRLMPIADVRGITVYQVIVSGESVRYHV